MVKEKGCCIGCLNRGHRMHECRSKRVCGIEGCQQTHCQLLHNRNARNSEESSHITQQQRNQSSEQEVALSAVSGRSNCNINYNVIPIYAKRRDGQLLPMYMVLDGYASLTSADDSIRQQLNVDGRRRPLTVQGFQSTTTTPNSYEVDIEIVSRLDGKSYTLRNVRTVPKLDLPSQSLTKETLKRFSHIEGTPILTYQNVVPTILVGMDNFELHLPEEMKIGRFGEPAAIRTAMGWALVGPTASPPKKLHHAFHINDQQDDPLHQLVKQFFTTEYVRDFVKDRIHLNLNPGMNKFWGELLVLLVGGECSTEILQECSNVVDSNWELLRLAVAGGDLYIVRKRQIQLYFDLCKVVTRTHEFPKGYHLRRAVVGLISVMGDRTDVSVFQRILDGLLEYSKQQGV
ncbi:Gag-Pol polyprotein [Folsomia candida]|uniref:Gag-Pol polyprotein n=1 Tax=Folsomia candida TaxID=158441 RepID=A0A226DAJ2_FOLCA|nr:Gag-Pol polyprotein [Folsomia candida]